ncbi:hypothetical protein SPJ2_1052 [Streptococcus parauberis KRS-02109]|nr:hypothetical protein SPJ2_1052 [Streptococcus parauberis KRS-02109]
MVIVCYRFSNSTSLFGKFYHLSTGSLFSDRTTFIFHNHCSPLVNNS